MHAGLFSGCSMLAGHRRTSSALPTPPRCLPVPIPCFHVSTPHSACPIAACPAASICPPRPTEVFSCTPLCRASRHRIPYVLLPTYAHYSFFPSENLLAHTSATAPSGFTANIARPDHDDD